MLEALLEDGMFLASTRVNRRAQFPRGVTRDAVWRNDFCRQVHVELFIIAFSHHSRYLSFVRNAFAGTPTLTKEIISEDDIKAGVATSDILYGSPSIRFH